MSSTLFLLSIHESLPSKLSFANSQMEIANRITSLENNRKNVSKSFDKTRKEYFEDDTLNENDEEEDRVFLRPGAVHSPLNNLNKRTSVDFNQSASESRNSKSRSMSLPVTYSELDLDNIFSSDHESSNSCFQNVSSSNSSLLSPLRKTDFAFCKLKICSIQNLSSQKFHSKFGRDLLSESISLSVF